MVLLAVLAERAVMVVLVDQVVLVTVVPVKQGRLVALVAPVVL
jgi:hypothetical protein